MQDLKDKAIIEAQTLIALLSPKTLKNEESHPRREKDTENREDLKALEKIFKEQKPNQDEKDEKEINKRLKISSLLSNAKEIFINKNQVTPEGKIEIIYESPQDLTGIFRLEKRLFEVMFRLLLIMIALFILLVIAIIIIMPLKEKEPFLVTFANDRQNFAIVQKADDTITANEALNRQLIGAYILNREVINQIDDKERMEVVREQSSTKVWRIFEKIVSEHESIYTNSNLQREVNIINVSILTQKKKASIASADVDIKLFFQGILQSQKRYRITLAYKFVIENTIEFASMPKNPTGFRVTEYAITEIATIKKLDKENRVEKSSGNKIQYKNNPNTSQDYSFKTPSLIGNDNSNSESDLGIEGGQ